MFLQPASALYTKRKMFPECKAQASETKNHECKYLSFSLSLVFLAQKPERAARTSSISISCLAPLLLFPQAATNNNLPFEVLVWEYSSKWERRRECEDCLMTGTQTSRSCYLSLTLGTGRCVAGETTSSPVVSVILGWPELDLEVPLAPG